MDLSARLLLNEINEEKNINLTNDAESLLQGILRTQAEEILKEASQKAIEDDKDTLTQQHILETIREEK